VPFKRSQIDFISRFESAATGASLGRYRRARSGDLPNDMIMVGAHVPTKAAEALRDAVLGNKAQVIAGITAHEENDKYVGMDLVAIEDSAYDYVRSMYSNAGYPQFDDFIGD